MGAHLPGGGNFFGQADKPMVVKPDRTGELRRALEEAQFVNVNLTAERDVLREKLAKIHSYAMDAESSQLRGYVIGMAWREGTS